MESSSSSSSYRPPRRALLTSLLLAALLLLSAPTPSLASSSTVPHPSPTPAPHLRTSPSLLFPGTIPVQLPFLEPLEWPSTNEDEEEEDVELEIKEEDRGRIEPPSINPSQQQQQHQTHSRPSRLPSPSLRMRGTSLGRRQETEQEAGETAVATVEASINPSSAGNPLAVASATTDSLSSSTPTPTSSSASAAAATTTTSEGKVAPPVSTPAAPVPNPFPQPFDLTLNLNLTSTCLDYFAYFLSSQSFQACRAFSLLFSSSSAFSSIASQDNLTDITAVVQATLNSSSTCESSMVGMGTTLADRCKADLVAGVPIAKEALTGFQTFGMMKKASALVSPDSGAYCYVEALASHQPADLFLWNLYTGAALPNTSLPSCSSCTKDLFAVYQSYASNGSLALTASYSSAVELSNTHCGSSFATTVVAVSSGSSTLSFSTTRLTALLSLVALSFTL